MEVSPFGQFLLRDSQGVTERANVLSELDEDGVFHAVNDGRGEDYESTGYKWRDGAGFPFSRE